MWRLGFFENFLTNLLLLSLVLHPATCDLPRRLYCVERTCSVAIITGHILKSVSISDGVSLRQGQSVDVVAKSAQRGNSFLKIRVDNQFHFLDASFVQESEPIQTDRLLIVPFDQQSNREQASVQPTEAIPHEPSTTTELPPKSVPLTDANVSKPPANVDGKTSTTEVKDSSTLQSPNSDDTASSASGSIPESVRDGLANKIGELPSSRPPLRDSEHHEASRSDSTLKSVKNDSEEEPQQPPAKKQPGVDIGIGPSLPNANPVVNRGADENLSLSKMHSSHNSEPTPDGRVPNPATDKSIKPASDLPIDDSQASLSKSHPVSQLNTESVNNLTAHSGSSIPSVATEHEANDNSNLTDDKIKNIANASAPTSRPHGTAPDKTSVPTAAEHEAEDSSDSTDDKGNNIAKASIPTSIPHDTASSDKTSVPTAAEHEAEDSSDSTDDKGNNIAKASIPTSIPHDTASSDKTSAPTAAEHEAKDSSDSTDDKVNNIAKASIPTSIPHDTASSDKTHAPSTSGLSAVDATNDNQELNNVYQQPSNESIPQAMDDGLNPSTVNQHPKVSPQSTNGEMPQKLTSSSSIQSNSTASSHDAVEGPGVEISSIPSQSENETDDQPPISSSSDESHLNVTNDETPTLILDKKSNVHSKEIPKSTNLPTNNPEVPKQDSSGSFNSESSTVSQPSDERKVDVPMPETIVEADASNSEIVNSSLATDSAPSQANSDMHHNPHRDDDSKEDLASLVNPSEKPDNPESIEKATPNVDYEPYNDSGMDNTQQFERDADDLPHVNNVDMDTSARHADVPSHNDRSDLGLDTHHKLATDIRDVIIDSEKLLANNVSAENLTQGQSTLNIMHTPLGHYSAAELRQYCDMASLGPKSCIVWLSNGTIAFPSSRSRFAKALTYFTTLLSSTSDQLLVRIPDSLRSESDRLLLTYTALSLRVFAAWCLFVVYLSITWLCIKLTMSMLGSAVGKPNLSPPSLSEYILQQEHIVQLTDRLAEQEQANGQLANHVSVLTSQLKAATTQAYNSQNLKDDALFEIDEVVAQKDHELLLVKQSHVEFESTCKLLISEKDQRIADLQSEIGRLANDKEGKLGECRAELAKITEERKVASEAAKKEQEELYYQAMNYYNRMKAMQPELDKLIEVRKQAESKLADGEAELATLRETFTTLKSFEVALQEHVQKQSKESANSGEKFELIIETVDDSAKSGDEHPLQDRKEASSEALDVDADVDEDEQVVKDEDDKGEEAEGGDAPAVVPNPTSYSTESSISIEDAFDAKSAARDRAAISANLALFLDAGRLHSEINTLKIQLSSEESNVKFERELRVELESKVAEIESRLGELEAECKRLEAEKSAAETKLELLSTYFRDRESELQQSLSKHVSVGTESTEALSSVKRRNRELELELKSLRDQLALVRRELDEAQRNARRQIAELDKRSHESMLKARAADSQVDELRNENARFRSMLTVEGPSNTMHPNPTSRSSVVGLPSPHRRLNAEPPVGGLPFLPPPPPPPGMALPHGLLGSRMPGMPMLTRPPGVGGQMPFMMPPPPPPPPHLSSKSRLSSKTHSPASSISGRPDYRTR